MIVARDVRRRRRRPIETVETALVIFLGYFWAGMVLVRLVAAWRH